MAYFEVQFIKGWLLGSYEEKERFLEATDYKYEDSIHSAVPGQGPYFFGDCIGSVPAGFYYPCDEMNRLMFEPDHLTCVNGVTEKVDEWLPMLANAGYTEENSEFFYDPLTYIVAYMDY